ncbi:MAG TPA: helix-turn-helix transcriptional regulator [Caulobacteraceae bacterium]|jgi:transcriptional regulator with XRE-family HTH domain|nr:helix-turn-helix transcriptional regulator [Caulobacteraceae bacterium]
MTVGQRIKHAREQLGWSQTRLAAAVHQAQTTISSWERDRTEPTREDVARVAAALGVTVGALERGDEAGLRATPLVGYVGAGGQFYFGAADEGLGEVPIPEGGTEQTRAAEIRGESLGPLFEHWLVYYDDVRTPVTPDLIGQLCIVGLPDDRVLVKKIQPSRTPGLYHLLSNTEAPLLDQEVVWAARIRSMAPR